MIPCRYCGRDCSDARSWDGGDFYACGKCADARSAEYQRGAGPRYLGRHRYDPDAAIADPARHRCEIVTHRSRCPESAGFVVASRDVVKAVCGFCLPEITRSGPVVVGRLRVA